MATMSIRFRDDVYERLKKRAEVLDVPMSTLVKIAVTEKYPNEEVYWDALEHNNGEGVRPSEFIEALEKIRSERAKV